MGNQRKKTPKHKDPVLLGLPDGAIESSDDVDAYITKIGGVPVSPKRFISKFFLVLTVCFIVLGMARL